MEFLNFNASFLWGMHLCFRMRNEKFNAIMEDIVSGWKYSIPNVSHACMHHFFKLFKKFSQTSSI